jgi:hypothetical protein
VDGGVDVGVLAEDALQQGHVGDVAVVEGAPAGEFSPPGDERVEDDRGVPGVFQCRCDGAADVSGAAGDENFHGMVSPLG